MEEVYSHLVVTEGYREPLTHPDNDRINVYFGGYRDYSNGGWASPTHYFNEINQTVKASADIFMNIYNYDAEESFRSTFAHELFHAIEWAYRYTTSNCMYEAMSSYWAHRIPDGNDALVFQNIKDYLDNTNLSIDYENYYDQISSEYGAVIFLWYLEQNVDSGIFSEIVERLDSQGTINYSILEIIEVFYYYIILILMMFTLILHNTIMIWVLEIIMECGMLTTGVMVLQFLQKQRQ